MSIKKTILKTCLTSLIALLPISAIAQVTHTIPARRARGIEEHIAEIKVYPYDTGSTIVNFRPTQEVIRQVSLVGSSLMLSSDDPDCLSSEGRGASEACSATLLYLQQKPREAVPASQRISKTRMNVVTDKNIYTFQITLDSGFPAYSIVEIQPEEKQYSPLISIDQITALTKGFQVAEAEQYLNNPELNSRLRQFLEIVRTEQSLEAAAAKARISMNAVNKLLELGNQKNERSHY